MFRLNNRMQNPNWRRPAGHVCPKIALGTQGHPQMARIFGEIGVRYQAGHDACDRVVRLPGAQAFWIKKCFCNAIGAIELHPLGHKLAVLIIRILGKIDAPCATVYRDFKPLVVILNAIPRA